MTTECDLLTAPRRRADNSRVLDLEAYTTKLYMSEGGSKLIRRANGNVEKQHRLFVGKLPVAYSAEGNNRYLYLLDGALTSYAKDEQLRQDGGTPVPPCITALDAGVTQVSLEIDDRTDRYAFPGNVAEGAEPYMDDLPNVPCKLQSQHNCLQGNICLSMHWLH